MGLFSFTGTGNEKLNNHPISYSDKKKRKVGSLKVSAIGLGCMSMAGVYNPRQDKAEIANALILPKYMDHFLVKKLLAKH